MAMLHHCNTSSGSLAAKEKELPPIPQESPVSQKSSPLLRNSSFVSEKSPVVLHSPGFQKSPVSQRHDSQRSDFHRHELQRRDSQRSDFQRHDSHSHFETRKSPVSHNQFVPPKQTFQNQNFQNQNFQNQTFVPQPEPLMAPKSLNRKNVKKLSFDPAPADPNLPDDYSGESSRFDILQKPRAKKYPRPAPLLNLAKPAAPAGLGAGGLVSSLKSLELSNTTSDHNTEYMTRAAGSALGGAANRHSVHGKRQTIISSISPTKSMNTPSPRDSKPLTSPLPSTPIATTSTSMNLRDDDLVHLKDLGSGNSGVVSKVLHIPSQKTMARKVVLIDSKLAVQTQIIRELRIMHECRSPYIIDFYGAFLRTNNSIVICMEYCNCGSLDKILQLCAPKRFPDYVLKKLSLSILSGLAYLYDTHKIIHRDIKPSNVLMTHKGEFKLCDFGVSRELTNSIAMADTFVGTSVYMSPERIQGSTYGIKSDVWSMGLMLYELASGRDVWSDETENEEDHEDESRAKGPGARNAGPEGILDLLQRIVNEQSPTLSGKMDMASHGPFDADLTSFIDACLIKNDSQRASPQALLQHPFLKDVESHEKKVKVWAKSIRKQHKGD